MRDLEKLLTGEMQDEEWKEYGRRWRDDYAKGLVVECDMDEDGAKEIADIRFEDYVGQEGFTGRDEAIVMRRDRLWDKFKTLVPEKGPQRFVLDPEEGYVVFGLREGKYTLWRLDGTILRELEKPLEYMKAYGHHYAVEKLKELGVKE